MKKSTGKAKKQTGRVRIVARKIGNAVLWLFKRPVYAYLAILLVLAMLIGASALSWKLGLPEAARDFAVAEYAYLKAGPAIPVDLKVVDYVQGNVLPGDDSWGIYTNSAWLSNTERRIVPYFYYVGINGSVDPNYPAGIYPIFIYFTPMVDDSNFHLLGQEQIAIIMTPGGVATGPMIRLNERMITGDATDMRVLLATVIHETIHGQGGNFTFSGTCPDPITNAADLKCWQDESAQLESNTQTATIEVLAAYCNHQNTLACKAFWYEVQDAASSSLQWWAWEHNLRSVYNFIAKHMWRTTSPAAQYDASMRYWAGAGGEGRLKEIVYKYGKVVWDKTLRGAVQGIPLPTGNVSLVQATADYSVFQEVNMTFADVHYLFGNLLTLFLGLLS